ncbi:MAG TPA: alpha/beta fold hydrolase [Vicinamibacterales bacterium]|jgi:pimeloyl-ACP methyl ester carboxylesterase|nr:alpha/beta fold hydrolase [Vicinamibacterales bacterium]
MPSLGRFHYLEAVPSSATPRREVRTLVLVHAFPLNAEMWRPQLALAERGWRVIAPDLRGMGESPADRTVERMDDYVGDLVDLLDGLHVERAVIGGLSLGGYVTLALFKHVPSYFTGMILADTRPQADTAEGIEGRKKMLALLAQDGVQGVIEQMLPKLLGETTRRERPEISEAIRRVARENHPEGVAGALRAMMTRADSTGLLASIRCPTLIIVGSDDVLTPPELSRGMHEAIPGSTLQVIEGAGHLSNCERSERFNEVVGEFLDRRV